MKRIFISLAVVLLVAPGLFAASGEALSLVPADATTVGMVRLHDLRSSPLSSRLFRDTDRLTVDGDAAKFMSEAGLRPSEDVDVVMVSISPKASKSDSPRTLAAFEGRFDPNKLSKAIVSRGGERRTSPNGIYFVLPDHNKGKSDETAVVSFVSNRLVVAGTESSVLAALASRAAGGTSFSRSTLARELSEVDPSATSWLLIDVPASTRYKSGPNWEGPNSGPGANVAAVLKNVTTMSIWATDAGDAMKFGATARSDDAETIDLLDDTVRGLLAAWRLTVQEKAPELVSVIRRFEVSQQRNGITLTGTIPAELIRSLSKKNKVAK